MNFYIKKIRFFFILKMEENLKRRKDLIKSITLETYLDFLPIEDKKEDNMQIVPRYYTLKQFKKCYLLWFTIKNERADCETQNDPTVSPIGRISESKLLNRIVSSLSHNFAPKNKTELQCLLYFISLTISRFSDDMELLRELNNEYTQYFHNFITDKVVYVKKNQLTRVKNKSTKDITCYTNMINYYHFVISNMTHIKINWKVLINIILGYIQYVDEYVEIPDIDEFIFSREFVLSSLNAVLTSFYDLIDQKVGPSLWSYLTSYEKKDTFKDLEIFKRMFLEHGKKIIV